jgi:hypothetical protein
VLHIRRAVTGTRRQVHVQGIHTSTKNSHPSVIMDAPVLTGSPSLPGSNMLANARYTAPRTCRAGTKLNA